MSPTLHRAALAAVLSVASIYLIGCQHTPSKPSDSDRPRYGHFEQPIHTEWHADGRKMVLLRDVVFVDGQGTKWTAPDRATIDGASIPAIFWSFVTGPYEGRHRDASVVHDFECCVKLRPWRKAHRMYFDAMMARGEEEGRAKLMYWAVYWFGPRWNDTQITARFTEADVARAVQFFEQNPNISVDEVERLDARTLRSRAPPISPETVARYGLVPERVVEPIQEAPRRCFDGQ